MVAQIDREHNTYRIHVHGQVRRETEQAVVQGGHVAPHDEEHDTGIVELVSPLRHVLGVIHKRVERSAHAQAQQGATEEAGEDEEVGGGGGGVGFDVARTGIASVGFVGFPSVGKVRFPSNTSWHGTKCP